MTYRCTCRGPDEDRSLLAIAPRSLSELAGYLISWREQQVLEVRNQLPSPVVLHLFERIMANRKYFHGDGSRSKARITAVVQFIVSCVLCFALRLLLNNCKDNIYKVMNLSVVWYGH